MGITLNPQGNVLHFSIAALFVAQLYGQPLSWEQLGIVVVASVLTSVAASGAPGVAALGMLTLVLEPLGLPAAVGLILLTAIDKAAQDGKISRQEVLKHLSRTKEYSGILGFPVTFDKKGDLEGGATYFFQVKGKDFKQIAVMTGK